MSFGKRKIPKHLIIEDPYRQKKSYGLAWLALATLVLLASMMMSMYVTASDNTYQVQSGQLTLRDGEGTSQAALHLSSAVDVVINAMVAHAHLTQSFTNHSQQWQEGVYVFPLPENAAVNAMQMRVGERIIIGTIREKQAAKRIYEQSKEAGKRAAITEQQRPNIFTQRVANIAPGQTVQISLTYIQLVPFRQGEFSWRFPMTMTPRYFAPTFPNGPNDEKDNTQALKKNTDFNELPASNSLQQLEFSGEGWASSAVQELDTCPLPSSIEQFDDRGVKNPISITIQLNSGLPLANISSPYHKVQVQKEQTQHVIKLTENTAFMDRDFVLNWKPTASSSPQAAIFSEELDGEFYSLLMLMPPQVQGENLALPRDVVFIIDTSGSMQGASIQQAKASLKRGLAKLRTRDRFSIVAFNSHYRVLYPSLHPATVHNINTATRWVDQLQADGGTEMVSALRASLNLFEASHALQQTIFITDGAVTNETAMFQTIRNELLNSRLFTVGIGSAPNSYFMKKAAQFGRGSFTYIDDLGQVSAKIDSLFTMLDDTVAKDIEATWPGESEIFPGKIPDLYLAEPLIVTARTEDLKGEVLISGTSSLQTWKQYLSLEHHKNAEGISTVWAREKIEDLEDQRIAGAAPESIKEKITELALRHKLLSAYTSFVAVEQQASEPPETALKTSPVSNQLPAGAARYLRPVHYPSTATTAEITWWLGLFSLMLAIVITRLRD